MSARKISSAFTVVAAILIIGCLVKAERQQAQFPVIWNAPKGESVTAIAFCSDENIAISSWHQIPGKSFPDNFKEFTITSMDLSGRDVRKISLGSNYESCEIVDTAVKNQLLAVNCVEGGKHWHDRPLLVNMKTLKAMLLDTDDIFPMNVGGNSDAFSDDETKMLVMPATRNRYKQVGARIISSTSGELIRRIEGLPPYLGVNIRWADSSTFKWIDRKTHVMGGETQSKVTADSSSAMLKDKNAFTVLSLDSSKVAIFNRELKGMLEISFYDTAKGCLISTVKCKIRSTEGIESIKWSPDGNYLIVGLHDSDNYFGTMLVVLNTSGYMRKLETPLPSWRFIGLATGYAWSPDGRRIAAVIYREKKDPDHFAVAVMNVN